MKQFRTQATRNFIRRTASVAVALAITAGGLATAAVTAIPAYAGAYTAKVITTGSGVGNVNIRQSTNTSSVIYRTVPAGSSIGLNCYAFGQSLTGRYGASSMWYAVDGGGWISDAYVYTGTSNAVTPACKTAKVITTGSGVGDVNIRPEPNTYRAPIRVVAAGSVVPLGCNTNGQSLTGRYGASSLWYQVVGGGWISDAYVYTGTSNPVTAACVSGPAPAPSSKADRAAAWAQSMVGTTGWNGWCERFVENAYGVSGKFGSAIAHYNAVRGLVSTAGTPPKGAVVFYGAAAINGYYGHVMISLGDGRYVTTADSIKIVGQSWPGAPYLGWYIPSQWPGR